MTDEPNIVELALPGWWALLGALSVDESVHEPYRLAAETAQVELLRLWTVERQANP